MIWVWGGVAVLALLVLPFVYMSSVLAWSDQKTNGLEYYGLPPDQRDRFKKTLRVHALLLLPFLRLVGLMSRLKLENATFVEGGVAGPKGTCSAESFVRGLVYEPRPSDVFVVTQMKCGTTWMQHLVYEVLNRGNGDLVESGRTLYAVSPWLEALKSVSIEEAPAVGLERPSRLVKTHFPADACPSSPDARYVYVARHPVSCFASCVDFIATNAGSMAPRLEAVEAWFTSDAGMWWGTWPSHVAGWWSRSRDDDNVLFVHFEDMKRDLGGVIARVAAFLSMEPLTEEETSAVAAKCDFHYMREHRGSFEMHPPHLLQTDAELFVRGTAERHSDVPEDAKRRILDWCAREMAESDYPLSEHYPDVAAARS